MKSVLIEDGVQVIGEKAFSYTGIESLALPDSITSIGDDSFYCCGSLESAKLSSNLQIVSKNAFSGCVALKSIEIPNGVEKIGNGAFSGCSELKTVVLPETVCEINSPFLRCEKLEEITILNPNCVLLGNQYAIHNSFKENKYIGTIRGYDDSTAQKYAETYGDTFESLGAAPVATTTTTTTTTTTAKPTTTTTTTTSTASTTTTTSATAQETTTTTTATPEQPAVVFGDPTGDGKVDSKDASFVLVEYAKLSTGGESSLTEAEKSASDVNKDGKNDSKDASIILSYYAYISTSGTDSLEEFLKNQ